MKLRPIILVDVSNDYFYFTHNRHSIRFATYMNIQVERGKPMPIAIGENREIPNSILLGIFDFEAITKLNIKKTSLLQLMMEYGIGKLLEKYWYPVLRPLVIFRGHRQLANYIGDNYKAILETSALRGGAGKVDFE